ncbi:MAG: type II toxin-antitoxin system HicA family toxin [bacterium]|jgi:predicted RNA binding protein YcfA (HicA-like mRNA interferase family)
MEKRLGNEIIKITVPTHKPIKRSTLSHILKQAKIKAEDFMLLL